MADLRHRSYHNDFQSLFDSAISDEVLAEIERSFPVRITPEMAALSRSSLGVARQFLPAVAELTSSMVDLVDPIGDERFSPLKGLVHRYPDRVLLKVTNTCAVHCRFCFRRNNLLESTPLGSDALDAALDYIKAKPEIWEVVLSGGDPLTLSDSRLRFLLDRLEAIPHVSVVRIHTRVPVANPGRISKTLLDLLNRPKALYIVLHVNHADELGVAARQALARMVARGVPLLSQTVLLKGINDTADALTTLFRALVALKVKPYYLHHPDRAKGTGHFYVSLEDGQNLMKELRGRLSGICQPTYVLDIPGGLGKVPVGPIYIVPEANNVWSVADYQDRRHHYDEAAELQNAGIR